MHITLQRYQKHVIQSAGDTALHIATLRNHHAVVKELVLLKANLDVSNKVSFFFFLAIPG